MSEESSSEELYATCISTTVMQMGMMFSLHCGGNILLDNHSFVAQTTGKLLVVNSILVDVDFASTFSSITSYVDYYLWNIIENAERLMKDSNNNLLPYSIHFPVKQSQLSVIHQIKDYLLLKFNDIKDIKWTTNSSEDSAMIYHCKNFNLSENDYSSNVSFRKLNNENDYIKYIEIMQDAFNFSKDIHDVKEINKILFYPHRVENTNDKLSWVYENYFAHLNSDETNQPACIGRIVQLSLNYLRKFKELNDWCDYIEKILPHSDSFCCIIALATKSEYRKQGLASSMSNFLIKRAKDIGCTTIGLYSPDRNIPFYSSLGFKIISSEISIYRSPL